MLITEYLKLDHARIRKLLAILETAPGKNRMTEKVRLTAAVRELTALQRVHEAIEEDILMPALSSRQANAEPGLLGEFELAHKETWKRLRDLETCVTQDYPLNTIARTVSAYAGGLRLHLKAEEKTLFPLADMVLPRPESERLAEAAKKRETEALGPGMAAA